IFGSPNGLDSHLTDAEHHSTAYDMALITAYALQNENFREIIAQPEITIEDVSGKHICHVTNTDRFLREYDGAIGVKTGYTNKAGHCFVGAAERDDVLLISAVLGSGWGDAGKQKKWTDTKALMEYGFANFKPSEVLKKEDIFGEVKILNSPMERVETVLAEGYTALFSEEEKENLQIEAKLPQEIKAPVEKGQKLGTAVLFLGEEKLAEIDLLAQEEARPFALSEWMHKLAENWLCWRKF
ncbi:MAG: D-alanyl-D-alanine carboxypeptidase, partial [Anaerotignum sp.]|nr:D-alanyl-D-alanine carboxypeptidase [Anaerotignum sp.]